MMSATSPSVSRLLNQPIPAQNFDVLAQVVVIRKNQKDGTPYPLTDRTCTFGRDPECDIRIQLKTVSHSHCKLILEDDREPSNQGNDSNQGSAQLLKAYIVVTGENGILLNGKRILASDEKIRLKDKDVFVIEERKFRFEFVSPSSNPLASPSVLKSQKQLTGTPRTPLIQRNTPLGKESPLALAANNDLKIHMKDERITLTPKKRPRPENIFHPGTPKSNEIKPIESVKNSPPTLKQQKTPVKALKSPFKKMTSNVDQVLNMDNENLNHLRLQSPLRPQKVAIPSHEVSQSPLVKATLMLTPSKLAKKQNDSKSSTPKKALSFAVQELSNVDDSTKGSIDNLLDLNVTNSAVSTCNTFTVSNNPTAEGNVSVNPEVDSEFSSKRKLCFTNEENIVGTPSGKKIVSFGPQLSPEIFDKSLPPASPIKRGSSPLASSPAVSKKFKERDTEIPTASKLSQVLSYEVDHENSVNMDELEEIKIRSSEPNSTIDESVNNDDFTPNDLKCGPSEEDITMKLKDENSSIVESRGDLPVNFEVKVVEEHEEGLSESQNTLQSMIEDSKVESLIVNEKDVNETTNELDEESMKKDEATNINISVTEERTISSIEDDKDVVEAAISPENFNHEDVNNSNTIEKEEVVMNSEKLLESVKEETEAPSSVMQENVLQVELPQQEDIKSLNTISSPLKVELTKKAQELTRKNEKLHLIDAKTLNTPLRRSIRKGVPLRKVSISEPKELVDEPEFESPEISSLEEASVKSCVVKNGDSSNYDNLKSDEPGSEIKESTNEGTSRIESQESIGEKVEIQEPTDEKSPEGSVEACKIEREEESEDTVKGSQILESKEETVASEKNVFEQKESETEVTSTEIQKGEDSIRDSPVRNERQSVSLKDIPLTSDSGTLHLSEPPINSENEQAKVAIGTPVRRSCRSTKGLLLTPIFSPSMSSTRSLHTASTAAATTVTPSSDPATSLTNNSTRGRKRKAPVTNLETPDNTTPAITQGRAKGAGKKKALLTSAAVDVDDNSIDASAIVLTGEGEKDSSENGNKNSAVIESLPEEEANKSVAVPKRRGRPPTKRKEVESTISIPLVEEAQVSVDSEPKSSTEPVSEAAEVTQSVNTPKKRGRKPKQQELPQPPAIVPVNEALPARKRTKKQEVVVQEKKQVESIITPVEQKPKSPARKRTKKQVEEKQVEERQVEEIITLAEEKPKSPARKRTKKQNEVAQVEEIIIAPAEEKPKSAPAKRGRAKSSSNPASNIVQEVAAEEPDAVVSKRSLRSRK